MTLTGMTLLNMFKTSVRVTLRKSGAVVDLALECFTGSLSLNEKALITRYGNFKDVSDSFQFPPPFLHILQQFLS